jgi:hypothetical protein
MSISVVISRVENHYQQEPHYFIARSGGGARRRAHFSTPVMKKNRLGGKLIIQLFDAKLFCTPAELLLC